MKNKMKLVVGVLFATAFVAQADEIRSNIQNSGSTFGNLQGVAIDFDSTDVDRSTATPALTNGVTYQIDSLQVRVNTSHGEFGATRDVYLAVYTGLNGAALSGFLGASASAVTLTDNSGIVNAKWTFSDSNITVTPEANAGSGGDQRYFVFQSVDTALTTLEAFKVPLMRQSAQYVNVLSGIIRRDGGNSGVQRTRNPNYIATLHTIPEPATLGMVLLMGGGLFYARRRRILR